MKLHSAVKNDLQGVADFTSSASGRHDLPAGLMDRVGLSIAVIIAIVAVALCVKFFLHPGERDRNHIKWRVLD